VDDIATAPAEGPFGDGQPTASRRPVAAGPQALAEAWQAADALTAAAGVEIRLLETAAEFEQGVGLMDDAWGNGIELVAPNLMKALRLTDNYVAGAFDGGRMAAFCLAFRSMADPADIHSHILAVESAQLGRGIGTAFKFHQRAWAIERGIAVIEWTFDPLVARNAAFNLVRLGADVDQYLPDLYGQNDDKINRGQPSDRLMARWRLGSSKARAAARGERTVVPDEAAVEWVPVPDDIEALRLADPAAGLEWRLRVRAAFQEAFASQRRVVGYRPGRGYAIEAAS
jgi:predicted GNAT superfamily acetyltransferase